ncbi:MAG: DUF3754 domain-containing protein [Planctomycetia bacterium]|nr:DUF3754 domain-containing protein [Planctomycetia bacterium]
MNMTTWIKTLRECWERRWEKPQLDFLDVREYFIPVRLELILDALRQEDWTPQELEDLETLLVMIQEHCHYDYHHQFLKLKAAFVPFNPDIETVVEADFSEEERNRCREEILSGIRMFLTISNYCELSEEQFQECLKLQPLGGLAVKVRLDVFSKFHVFYRGVRMETVEEPVWYFWKKSRTVPILKRVFLMACYKNEVGNGKIIVKLFRDVRVENLKIMAPEVELLLPFFDKIKVGGTTLFGILPTLLKLANFSLKILTSVAFMTAALACVVAAVVKAIVGFFSSKNRCKSVFSSHLYYNTLANNVAAINTLIDQAETQEVKESLLACVLLYQNNKKGEQWTLSQLNDHVERWLFEHFHHPVDFEVDDALRKLVEKRVVEQKDGMLRVCSLRTARRRLDEIWDNFHQENNQGNPADDVVL